MDEETKKYIDTKAQEAKDFATAVTAKYDKSNTWWQRVRRERPVAVQNVLIFGYGPLLLLIGVAVGKYIK